MPDFPGAEQFIFEKISRELPSNLSYHAVHHTLDVLAAAMRIAAAEGLDEEEVKLLRVAVYFHDAGFISTYKGHEEVGCQMAEEILPSFGFDDQMIAQICGMIMATRLPQQPRTVAEQVIADADLDYLGRDDFYPIGETLFREFRIHLGVSDEHEWNRIQINFLRSHSYHTRYAQKLRSTAKAERLKELEALVYSYDR
jgi:predicted metal-dependent HD superfamily phosphohydrolase